ncbi:MAG: cytochrome c [Acidobacteriia bacterium]|nr:cytochrome c [Terriglobia bacterium]
MSRRTLNVALLAAFLASLALNWAVRPQPWRPNREFIPEMVRTPRFNAYSTNPNFPNGMTLQAPVGGTIPRGFLPVHYAPTPEDALRAGDTLESPLRPDDAQAIGRGSVVFSNFCAPCHGATGKGDGLVAQRGFPAPPSLYADNARKIKDGQIFHILTYGQKNMPSYASQLSREDRWRVIAFVRSLQKQASSVPAGGQP